MKISVVVPFFNTRKYIRDCIAALLDQDYPQEDYEIIMVDNNSSDGTAETVKEFSRIRLLSEKGQGSYRARNRGIRAARGELIAFTDSDCRPGRGWLSAFADAASHPRRGIVLGRREFASDSEGLTMLADYECVKAEYVFSSNKPEIYYGYTNNMAVSRALFDRLGNFIEVDRGADTVFVRRTVDALGCGSVTYSSRAWVRHLEMLSVRDYYAKKAIYGKSNQRNRPIGSARPLNSAERIRLFYRTVQSRRYPPFKACRLFALLSLGLFFYEYGRGTAEKAGGSSKAVDT